VSGVLRITKLREEKGWSRWELGRRAGIHPADIGKIESLRVRAYPGQQKRIADALGVPVGDLFDDQGWPVEEGESSER
jgi:transcriptional regulator with XRE-family HTH domain